MLEAMKPRKVQAPRILNSYLDELPSQSMHGQSRHWLGRSGAGEITKRGKRDLPSAPSRLNVRVAKTVDWQFTIDKARVKLKRLYPKV